MNGTAGRSSGGAARGSCLPSRHCARIPRRGQAATAGGDDRRALAACDRVDAISQCTSAQRRTRTFHRDVVDRGHIVSSAHRCMQTLWADARWLSQEEPTATHSDKPHDFLKILSGKWSSFYSCITMRRPIRVEALWLVALHDYQKGSKKFGCGNAQFSAAAHVQLTDESLEHTGVLERSRAWTRAPCFPTRNSSNEFRLSSPPRSHPLTQSRWDGASYAL